ncbi:hypothetical protein [uncultured Eubacterium sp.]|uniref:hypothetical protein n=1 Tax=uncultured Eubacterium sp. TaxID=165185 RepID=UPI002594B007|nr:hypothetical protein [uncultured Eubacterium sp.]
MKFKFFIMSLLLSSSLLIGCGSTKINSVPLSDTVSSSSENSTSTSSTNNTQKSFYAPEGFLSQTWDTDFNITKCYITNKVIGSNRFYIDENHILWGCGRNESGQLGINHPEDTNNTETYYTDYKKIAENVVHVDCSVNGYFLIYLTENGDLYGVGDNLDGILLNNIDAQNDPVDIPIGQNIQYTPKLLMTDVSYASAGMYSIAVLKNNGDAYWWGRTYGIHQIDIAEEPMIYNTPHLMLSNVKYVSCGDWTAAAITNANELYTWGSNFWGQCGIPTEDEYVKEATKVSDNVLMVWSETMQLNSVVDYWEPYWAMTYKYTYDNLFILKTDNTMYACGKDMGKETHSIQIDDDSESSDITGYYSTTFSPINIEQATFLPQ